MHKHPISMSAAAIPAMCNGHGNSASAASAAVSIINFSPPELFASGTAL
jgi:hypothetical protein